MFSICVVGLQLGNPPCMLLISALWRQRGVEVLSCRPGGNKVFVYVFFFFFKPSPVLLLEV